MEAEATLPRPSLMPTRTYDMLSIFPDLSVEAAIGRSYCFDALAPYTGTTPPEPLDVAGADTSESEQPNFTGLQLRGRIGRLQSGSGSKVPRIRWSLAADPEDAS